MSISQITGLLEKGSCEHEDATALACMSGDVLGLRYLHMCGYPLTSKSFYMAVKHNHIDCLDYLIDHRCYFNDKSFDVAVICSGDKMFARLMKLLKDSSEDGYPGLFAGDISDISDIYTSMLHKIVDVGRVDILKLFDDEIYKDSGMYTDGIFMKILKNKRIDMLNWCYGSGMLIGDAICSDFPVHVKWHLQLADFDTVRVQPYLKFFIEWFQNRDKKEGDSMRLCSYSEIICEFNKDPALVVLLCDTYQACKIPIEGDILKIFDCDMVAKTYVHFRSPQIVYDYKGVSLIVEWLVDHGVDIDVRLIEFWESDPKYYPWISVIYSI